MQAISVNGKGLYAQSTTNTAVDAESNNGDGVVAIANSSTNAVAAVRAIVDGTTSNQTALLGLATGSAWAVFAHGNAGGSTNWIKTSDRRLKKDIKDLGYGMAEVLKLHPVSYRLKEGDDSLQLGLIAQDVQKIVPEIVHTTAGDMLSIDYVSLVPVMLNAMQEQQKVISRQQERIDRLERQPIKAALGDVLPGAALAACLVPFGLVALRRKRTDSE
jgi:hypothetical protein